MKSDEPKRKNVTQPYLPKLEELTPYLEEIWKGKKVVNNGMFHKEFESSLCEFIGVDYISLFLKRYYHNTYCTKCIGI
jgi:hypothetical protein